MNDTTEVANKRVALSTRVRVILSWVAVAGAVPLAVRAVYKFNLLGDPTVFAPLLLAYVFRFELRPPIPRERGPSRRWLAIPIALCALYIIFPFDILPFVIIAAVVIWCIRDDISIYRSRSHEHPTA